MPRIRLLLIFLMFSAPLFPQKFEGLALTPPMGWNSWNTFATDIHEELIKGVADAFVEFGYKEAGYQYIVLDDGWMAMERDADGNLQADPQKFPGGMKALADYIHSKGLKFGLYNCAGSKTCAGYPGSRGHEYQDARKYAEWGVDFLKYDWCNTENLNAKGAYQTMRDALYAAGRPVVFSICEWGTDQPWTWGAEMGHLWRTSGDIVNCWDCEIGHGNWSSRGVWPIIRLREGIRRFSGPGHWNDFDMMEVGNGMSAAEDRVHFAMWAMLASPLIMGNDVRSASPETVKTLTNKAVIAVNQDKLGAMAFLFSDEGDFEVWAKPLAGEEWALVFVNMSEESRKLDFDWGKHPLEDGLHHRRVQLDKEPYAVRDLFKHRDIGTTATGLKATVPAHDLVMVRLKKQEN
ncbi:MAG TPA: glycoside hydrolase family 27 protein [Calditrichia bacterium]|nr:glycoside hydrolase family 27 protein [Calditrichota bacterium]HQU72002.1 glycoside hydrolase family 27 protein [Calditrichia bacterium]HQV32676.1 glycoside hydrolase family 27 protein [Calditrichia bacterium]